MMHVPYTIIGTWCIILCMPLVLNIFQINFNLESKHLTETSSYYQIKVTYLIKTVLRLVSSYLFASLTCIPKFALTNL